MNPLRTAITLLSLAVPTLAQGELLLPASANPVNELPNYGLYPFAYTNSHAQMFYDATEVGASNFTATSLSFRFDGPLPQVGSPGPFVIQRLEISIGTSTVSTPAARFADNLSAPLTSVFDASVSYLPDPGSASPHPWGAPSNSLVFNFTAPVAITIPTGGWLVVDIKMTNNNFFQFGFAHTILDAATTTGGPANGTAVQFGQGCSVDGILPPISIGMGGTAAPGAAHFLTATNLSPNMPVIAGSGLDNLQGPFGPLPYQLPGTACDLLISADVTALAFTNGAGSLIVGDANSFAVPPVVAFTGMVFHEQVFALAPAANLLGVAASNAQTVTLGTINPLGRGTVVVGHSKDPNAAVGTDVKALGTALRIGTL